MSLDDKKLYEYLHKTISNSWDLANDNEYEHEVVIANKEKLSFVDFEHKISPVLVPILYNMNLQFVEDFHLLYKNINPKTATHMNPSLVLRFKDRDVALKFKLLWSHRYEQYC